jgi:hypothetical protein
MDSLLPNQFHGSTTFNSKIKSYDGLAQRVRRTLGEPLIQIEVSSEQIYEFIDIAIEYFTKFAGDTEEYLIFRSDLYIKKVGLPVGRMMNLTPELYNPYNPDSHSTALSGVSAGYDEDLGDFRRVIDVFSFDQGNNSGVNTLFTIENTVAQQAYFGHLLGNMGFDLITFQALKTWLDTREKILGLMPYMRFDPDTQILRIIPEPTQTSIYYGLVGCRMQKPLKFLINQLWVYRYVLALTKIAVGHTRTKFQGTSLFGGQTVNGADVLRQGEKEKDELEKEITTDLIDRSPTNFFVG